MPNLRYIVGRTVNQSIHAVLGCQPIPLSRYVPFGLSWIYDIQRMARSRRLSVIFDAGANVGQTVSGLLRYFPKSTRIFCFEPVSATMQELKSAYQAHDNIVFVQTALGAEPSQGAMKLHQNSAFNSLSDRSGFDDLIGTSEQVPITTIDHFCEERSIQAIDILKMDIQGWELSAMRGAKSMLNANKITFVIAEVGFRSSDQDMQYFPPFHEFMDANGFVFCGLYEPFRWGPEKGEVYYGNALYRLGRENSAIVT
jgi:FkbM family methyltransferase